MQGPSQKGKSERHKIKNFMTVGRLECQCCHGVQKNSKTFKIGNMSNPNIYKKELKDLPNVEFGMICAKITRNSFLINKLCSLFFE